MADPFAPAIAGILSGLGYQCQEVADATFRDYDPALPTVYISPVGKPVIGFLAFQSKTVRQAYQLAYVYPNSLDPALVANDVFDFKTAVIAHFQGLATPMAFVGAWNTTVVDVTDYDSALFKKGYTNSRCKVLVDYLA